MELDLAGHVPDTLEVTTLGPMKAHQSLLSHKTKRGRREKEGKVQTRMVWMKKEMS